MDSKSSLISCICKWGKILIAPSANHHHTPPLEQIAAKEVFFFCSEYALCLYMKLSIASGNHKAERGTDQNIFHGTSEVERASKPDIDPVIGWSLVCNKTVEIFKPYSRGKEEVGEGTLWCSQSTASWLHEEINQRVIERKSLSCILIFMMDALLLLYSTGPYCVWASIIQSYSIIYKSVESRGARTVMDMILSQCFIRAEGRKNTPVVQLQHTGEG